MAISLFEIIVLAVVGWLIYSRTKSFETWWASLNHLDPAVQAEARRRLCRIGGGLLLAVGALGIVTHAFSERVILVAFVGGGILLVNGKRPDEAPAAAGLAADRRPAAAPPGPAPGPAPDETHYEQPPPPPLPQEAAARRVDADPYQRPFKEGLREAVEDARFVHLARNAARLCRSKRPDRADHQGTPAPSSAAVGAFGVAAMLFFFFLVSTIVLVGIINVRTWRPSPPTPPTLAREVPYGAARYVADSAPQAQAPQAQAPQVQAPVVQGPTTARMLASQPPAPAPQPTGVRRVVVDAAAAARIAANRPAAVSNTLRPADAPVEEVVMVRMTLDPGDPLTLPADRPAVVTVASDWLPDAAAAEQQAWSRAVEFLGMGLEADSPTTIDGWTPPPRWLASHALRDRAVERKGMLSQARLELDWNDAVVKKLAQAYVTESSNGWTLQLLQLYGGAVALVGGLGVLLRLGTGRPLPTA
ncbi:MAG: hypothetical protein ACRC1K_05210 [Planctomycetia bacterium]